MHSYPSLPYKVSPRGIHAHACELRLQAKLKFKAFGERYATSAGVAPWNEKWNKYKGKLIIAASCSVTDGRTHSALLAHLERSQLPACMTYQPAALQTNPKPWKHINALSRMPCQPAALQTLDHLA